MADTQDRQAGEDDSTGFAGDTADVIVLGGGPAGENAAAYAVAGSDRTAVIVEPELVGGECSYWACIPSKVLLRPAAVRADAAAVPGAVPSPAGPLDAAAVLGRRDAFIGRPAGAALPDDSGQVRWARGAGIAVVRGAGRLAGERTVAVRRGDTERVLHARHAVVLATGSTAVLPPTPGLAEARPWTSRDATAMTYVPRSVAVIGGGVVACEAATWLRALGSEVTMLVRGHALLGSAEPFAGALVADALEASGVRILYGTQAREVEREDVADAAGRGPGGRGGGPVTLRIGPAGDDPGAAAGTLRVDELLVATGRRPAVEGLGLETAGLDPARPPSTDAHMAVEGAGGWLYAVGDVTGRAPLTHMGKYQARVCGDVIAARAEGRSVDGPRFSAERGHRAVPQAVFTDPQAAWVGMTEAAARDAGVDVRTLAVDLGSVAGAALQRDGYTGRAQLVVDRTRGTVVGATFVGPESAELLHAATIAVVAEVPLAQLWHAVPAFPTASEAWLRMLEAAGDDVR